MITSTTIAPKSRSLYHLPLPVPYDLLTPVFLNVPQVVDENVLFHDIELARLLGVRLELIDPDVFAVRLTVLVMDSVARHLFVHTTVLDCLYGTAQDNLFLL